MLLSVCACVCVYLCLCECVYMCVHVCCVCVYVCVYVCVGRAGLSVHLLICYCRCFLDKPPMRVSHDRRGSFALSGTHRGDMRKTSVRAYYPPLPSPPLPSPPLPSPPLPSPPLPSPLLPSPTSDSSCCWVFCGCCYHFSQVFTGLLRGRQRRPGCHHYGIPSLS